MSIENILLTKLKKIKFLNNFIDDEFASQFKKYLIIGFTCFGLEYIIFLVLNQKTSIIFANSISITIIFWFNFLMNRFWSFKSKARLKKQLFQYALLFAFNIAVTNGFIYALSELIGILPAISKILVMGAVVCWNFIIYKKIIYI